MSASSQRVQEIPLAPSGTGRMLKEYFKINLYQFSLIWACHRRTGNLIGMQYGKVTASERKTLNWLANNGFIELNFDTECYEVTRWGKFVIKAAWLYVQEGGECSQVPGEILCFPSRSQEEKEYARPGRVNPGVPGADIIL